MENVSRRSFLKGVGAMGVGMGMMPILSVLGVDAKVKAEGLESAVEGLKYFANLNSSDELLEAVLAESEVTSDLTMSDGTVIPAVYDKDKCLQCGLCVSTCPMHSLSQDEDGYVVLDDACVRCGQCVPVCPGKARILKAMPDYPELPEDYIDCNRFFAKDRMQRGQLVDFTDSTLDV